MRKRFWLLIPLLIILIFLGVIHASPHSVASSFNQAKKEAQVLDAQARKSRVKGIIDLHKIIPRLGDPIPESSAAYYTKPEKLEEAGREKQAKTPQTDALVQTIKERPLFSIDENSDWIQEGKAIEKNAKAIVDQSVQHDQSCQVTEKEVRCTEPIRSFTKICLNIPQVVIKTSHQFKSMTFTGTIPPQSSTTGYIHILKTGRVTSFSVVMRSSNVWVCHQNYKAFLKGDVIANRSVNCGQWLGDLSFSNTQLSIPVVATERVAFHLNGTTYGPWNRATYTLVMQVDTVPHEPVVTWKEQCE